MDTRIEAWVGKHPGWAYVVTQDGRHVVKDPAGRPVASSYDPVEALKTVRLWV
jgi:hypothetical protein